MEVPDIHNIEFDLYKIKDVDVFDMFKKKIEAKLRELNIKYDIKLVDEHVMTGGSKSTYPYNVFEDTLDSIVGKKEENQKERKSLFDMLFASPKDKPPPSKPSGFFDMFQTSKNIPEEKKEKENLSMVESKNAKSILDSDAFSIKKAEVKDAYNTEPTVTLDDKEEEEKDKKEEDKEEENKEDKDAEEKEEDKDAEPSIAGKEEEDKEEKKDEEKSNIAESREATAEVKEEEELVEDFLKTQSIFIKVVVSIYHDKKNEKSLPAKIGIKKWLFN